jgi:hypothetical protein
MNYFLQAALNKFLTICVITIVFASCSVQKRHYQSGFHITWNKQHLLSNTENTHISKKSLKSTFSKIDSLNNKINIVEQIQLKLYKPKKGVIKLASYSKHNSGQKLNTKKNISIANTNHKIKTNDIYQPGLIDYSFVVFAFAGLFLFLLIFMIVLKAPLFVIIAAVLFFTIFLVAGYFLHKHYVEG